MNEVRLEIYADGNGNCTVHSNAASNVDIVTTLASVLASVCGAATTDKNALWAAVCARLLDDPPEYIYKPYGEQEG